MMTWLSVAFSQTTYFVNRTDDVDDGSCNADHCSLREAILAANADGVASIIEFKFLSGSAPFFITPGTDLPSLSEANTTIDVVANHPAGDVILLGGNSVPNDYGLSIKADDCAVYGLSITGWNKAGILINGFANDLKGIQIGQPAGPNYIYGNDKGIWIFAGSAYTVKESAISANYIGIDPQMSVGPSNQGVGITTSGAGTYENIVIGGNPNLSEGNVIVNHFAYGISAPRGAAIRGNFVGVDPIGIAMPNQSHGILMADTEMYIFENTISHNGGYGVYQNCGMCINNRISQNKIICNASGGISSSYSLPTILSTTPVVMGTAQPADTVELFLNESGCMDCQSELFVGSAIANSSGEWTIDLGSAYNGAYAATASNATGHTSALTACTDDDNCSTATYLTYSESGCVTDFHLSSSDGASPSGIAIASCSTDVGIAPVDLWYKAIAPSTGSLMLHLDTVNTTIHPLVEIYTGICGALTFLKCDSLTQYPYVLPIAELTPGEDVFLRIMDQGGDDFGLVGVALTVLPADSSLWQICEDKYDNRVATEFIVQYDAGTSPGDIQAVVAEIEAEGGVLIKSCDCSEQVLQLWKETTPIEMEDRVTSSKSKDNVDTTAYNFIIDERYCVTETQNVQVNVVSGPNGPFAITELVSTYDTTDCSQSGLVNLCSGIPGYAPVNPEYQVTFAILDTGVDAADPTIINAMWDNPELDDTDNCKLGDTMGYDFYNEDGSLEDLDGHGTGVNAVVACDFDPDIDLNLMNLKFYENGRSTLFDAVCGIYYAIDNGARVINISWGFITDSEVPRILLDAIQYARVKDVLIVTSAGNRGLDNDLINKYPANIDIDNLISVAAYEQANASDDPVLTPYSNYGNLSVDLAALGQAKVPTPGTMNDILAGTSLAAPAVGRTAAEIRARYPMLSAAEVKGCILSSVDAYPDFTAKVLSKGILNHEAAIDCAFQQALIKCNDEAVVIAADHQIDSLVLSQVSVTSDKTVGYPLSIIYQAKGFISLSYEFEVESGAEFLAEIRDCKVIIQPD